MIWLIIVCVGMACPYEGTIENVFSYRECFAKGIMQAAKSDGAAVYRYRCRRTGMAI